jgi:two-component system response regulator NreC
VHDTARDRKSKARILVVDDHQVVRSGIRNLLDSQSRWEVCGEAENGREGVAKAIELKPDLIILDLSMPLMNGFEAAEEIRRLAPNTKIVIFSMHDSRQISEQALRSGADAYVVKSSLFGELENVIHSLLDGDHRRPAASEE